MNENALKDLQQKIRNVVHDFELEHGLHGLMNVGMEASRITIEARESDGTFTMTSPTWDSGLENVLRGKQASGAVYDGETPYLPSSSPVSPPSPDVDWADLGERQMRLSETIIPNESGIDEPPAFPARLGEERNAVDLPDWVTDAQQQAEISEAGRVNSADVPRIDEGVPSDTQRMTAQSDPLKAADITHTTHAGYVYDDAPGMTFSSPEEHEAWQRQQQRRARR